jgi:hypothetical protein
MNTPLDQQVQKLSFVRKTIGSTMPQSCSSTTQHSSKHSRAGVSQRFRGGCVSWKTIISLVVVLLLSPFQDEQSIAGRNRHGELFVMAKNNKTPSPTRMPSRRPVTAKPSLTPTIRPTSMTPMPSVSQSTRPSTVTTEGPTLSPSELSVPSVAPTEATEFAVPTPEPSTEEPTTVPPSFNFIFSSLAAVDLPIISIEFTLEDNESSGESLSNLKEDLIAFLENVLATNGAIQNFYSLDVEFEIVQEALRERTKSRRLDTGIRVYMQGVALFNDDGTTASSTNNSTMPTTTQLTQVLEAYFSFWGTSDLTEDLQSFGLQSVKDVLVFLDGAQVQVLTEEGGQGGSPSSETETDPLNGPQIIPDNEKKLSSIKIGVLVALIALAVFVPGAVCLMICHGRKLRAEGEGDQASHSKTTPASTVGSRMGVTANPSTPTSTNDTTSFDAGAVNSPDFDSISIDHSMYTTDGTIAPPTPTRSISPTPAYDAKRLDQVIAAAKHHSHEQARKFNGAASE